MSGINLKNVIRLLKRFSKDKPLEVILVGGLSLEYYGLRRRSTMDIDAEVKGGEKRCSAACSRKA